MTMVGSTDCKESVLPLPPSLQGSQAREVGETENDREGRKKDKRTVRIKTLNSRNPCNLPFRIGL